MAPRRPGGIEGWPIVGLTSGAVATVVACVLATSGFDEAGVRAGIRATAGTSFALFLTAFVASSLNTLRPTPATKWLLRNRRYIGVSFAVSQLAHLLLIEDLSHLRGAPITTLAHKLTVVGGGFGYVMLLAMTITSFDRTARWLGRQRWSVLHTTGMYVFWAIFATSYGKRVALSPRYCVSFGLLIAALGIRAAARMRRVAVRSS
ncbi:MAG: hypothetical protein ACLQVI_21390 [Polyangiaceae bacterium]